MNKTKIEWCDYTVNPVKGLCPVACPYCYARAMYRRYKWDTVIKYDPTVFMDMPFNKPAKIFVGSTIDLFHPAVSGWNDEILSICRRTPEHTFIFLTKRPENLIKWSPFPDNCWIGISATDENKLSYAVEYLKGIEAAVKFVSIEPLLHWSEPARYPIYRKGIENSCLDWIIIGQQTPVNKKTSPKEEWILEIITAADKASIPVFLKDNLKSLFPDHPWLRQESPKTNKQLSFTKYGIR